ncbi:MAG TPA: VOC family protein [Candidatus Saccharimonadales bacterium]|nr:VOC family protein [Candidatus Saccharimonadales bacterium]
MLKDSTVMAMVAVKDIETAKQFYGQTLGLGEGEPNPAGVLYKSGAGQVFVYQAPTAGTNQGTSATWEVSDIKASVESLKSAGVSNWEHYEFPGAEHDGEVHLMFGSKAAWFKDPDGNILGLTEN